MEVPDVLNFSNHVHFFSQNLDFSSDVYLMAMLSSSLSGSPNSFFLDYLDFLHKSVDLSSGAPALSYTNHSVGL